MTRCMSAVVLKSVFVFARRPVICFTNNTTTHVSQLARLSSCWKWFFLAASIQSGEHLRQHKAHHRDTQNATNSTLTTAKPQTTSLVIQYGTQRRRRNTRGAQSRHTPTWSHLRSTHRLIWDAAGPPLPSIAPQAHERTCVPTLEIEEYMCRLAVVAVQRESALQVGGMLDMFLRVPRELVRKITPKRMLFDGKVDLNKMRTKYKSNAPHSHTCFSLSHAVFLTRCHDGSEALDSTRSATVSQDPQQKIAR